MVPLLFLFATAVSAGEIIDRIDVQANTDSADITVLFTKKILYLRNTPLNDGRELRVFIRLLEPNLYESDLDQEIVSSLKTDRVPDVKVLYPELINGMLVSFSNATEAKVKPGPDGQSIVITVPLLPLPAPDAPKVAVPVVAVAAAPAPVPAAAVPAPVVQTAAPITVPAAAPVAAQITAPVAATVRDVAPSAVQAVAAEPAAPASATDQGAVASPSPPVFSAAEIEASAISFLDKARQALQAKDPVTAINRLNRVLSMPSNQQTEAAQALIGEAREMNGEIMKARAEYELYLKLYADKPDAARIRARLAALPKSDPQRRVARALPTEPGEAVWTYNGSISSYYYHGNSQYETLTPPPPGQIVVSQSTLSLVDQNSWINSVNLNARRVDALSDTRIVVRDTDNHDYLNSLYSYNRLYSAYIDYNDFEYGYELKFGRQNPNGMGVLERFDGVVAGYKLGQDWRVNATGGEVVEFNAPYKKVFYGVSVDMLPQGSLPGVSLYAIQQSLDSYADRRAVGSELRYFDAGAAAYGMLDYDLLFKGVNIALLQGNYLGSNSDNYFFILDHRKAPSYSLTSALPAFPGLTLDQMVQNQGLDQVRLQASELTAISNMFAIGVTHPFTEKWQAGVDYRLSSLTSTHDVMAVIPLSVVGTCLGTIDPINNNCIISTASQAGSGLNNVLSMQVIGTNLFFDNEVFVSNISLIKAPTFKGEASSLGYIVPFLERYRVESNLRYYNQKDTTNDKQDRLSCSIKLSNQLSSNFYLEGEYGHELDHSSGPNSNDRSTRNYFYLGVRADIH